MDAAIAQFDAALCKNPDLPEAVKRPALNFSEKGLMLDAIALMPNSGADTRWTFPARASPKRWR
jgi:hypothetical protein